MIRSYLGRYEPARRARIFRIIAKDAYMAQWGLMLVNLGTPDSTSTGDVRRYLREFLSDPRVIDISAVGRWLLLNLIILPFRPKKSAEAYRKIWTGRGSPLRFHGWDLARKVQAELGDECLVELGMRYQNPSIAEVLRRFRVAGIDRIVVFPLFPQYSSAAWGSAVEKVYVEANRLWNVPVIQVVPPFYDHAAYIGACAARARPVLEEMRPDRVVMSYHGLPERHVIKSDETGGRHCLATEGCCEGMVSANRNCYRAQCYATSRALAAELELEEGAWEVTFQSRLGRSPWIKPYTDLRINELAEAGVKRVVVLSPSFVADCLETLEEMEIRGAEDFRAHGGEELRLVGSLNSEDIWVRGVVRILRDAWNAVSCRSGG